MQLRALIAIATIVPLVSVGVVFVPMRANERWDAMTKWADHAESAWDAHEFSRRPLSGELEHGNAFERYQKAMALASIRSEADRAVLKELRLHSDRADDAMRATFVERWSEPIARMRQGVRCDDARPAIEWRHGVGAQPLQLLPARDIANACVVEARRLLAAGKQQDFVALGLDAATFAIDLQQSPLLIDQMVASSIAAIVFTELFDEASIAGLDTEARAKLTGGVAAIETRCVRGVRLKGEALMLARSLQKSAEAETADMASERMGHPEQTEEESTDAGWRHGWSKRWAMAEGVLLLADVCEQLETGDGLNWPQREALLHAQRLRLRTAANPMTASWDEAIAGAERTLRIALCHVRLLQAALAATSGSPMEGIQDPFGDGPFQVARDGETLRVASAGGSKLHPLARKAVVR